MKKLVEERPYADPEAAARKLIKLAASIPPVQDGRIHIERINAPFLYTLKAKVSEFGAGLHYAIEKGWLELHESGTLRATSQAGRGPAGVSARRRVERPPFGVLVERRLLVRGHQRGHAECDDARGTQRP